MTVRNEIQAIHSEIEHIKENMDTIIAEYMATVNAKIARLDATVTDVNEINYLTVTLPYPLTHATEVIVTYRGHDYQFYQLASNRAVDFDFYLDDTFTVTESQPPGYNNFYIESARSIETLCNKGYYMANILQKRYGDDEDEAFDELDQIATVLSTTPLHPNQYIMHMYKLSNVIDALQAVIPKALAERITIHDASTSELRMTDTPNKIGLHVDNKALYQYCIQLAQPTPNGGM